MNLDDFTNIVLAATSIVAIILGVVSFWQQNKQAKTFLGIQILREWEQSFFYSDEMRSRRYKTCKSLNQQNEERIATEAWEILDNFGSIGIYVNRGIVDTELAWSTFYYWLDPYWFLLQKYSQQLQSSLDGVHYLKDVEDMHRLLTAYATKHRNLPSEDKRYSTHKIQEFINDEIKATYREEWA